MRTLKDDQQGKKTSTKKFPKREKMNMRETKEKCDAEKCQTQKKAFQKHFATNKGSKEQNNKGKTKTKKKSNTK